jgi:hypothetical protein
LNCQKIADRYRPLTSAHPGESPLKVVAASPASGVTLAEPLTRMEDPKSALPAWANKQTPSFTVPDGLTQSLISMSIWTLEKLPDVKTLEDGKITPQGHFAVGMIKGDLKNVSVSAVH